MSQFRRSHVSLAGEGHPLDAAQHVVGLLAIPLVALVSGGRAPLWLSPLIPVVVALLGPMVARARPGADAAISLRHHREARAFAVMVAAGYLAAFALLWLGGTDPVAVMLLPMGVLGVLVLTVSWFTFSLMGASRALHGLLLQYPFVPSFLRPRATSDPVRP